MHWRREQQATRPPPPLPPEAKLRILLAVLVLVPIAATETTTDAPTVPTQQPDKSDLPQSRCTCFNESFLNCSSLALKEITEENNRCTTNVTKIDVSFNEVESLLELRVQYQTELNASRNLIKEIRSTWLESGVDVVDVSWNEVVSLDVEDMKSLRVLNVSRNRLERVQALPSPCVLEVFDASHNRLEKFPDGIAECGNLRVVNVSNNEINQFPEGVFENFLAQDAYGPSTLVVDLRSNPLAYDDKSLRQLIDNDKLIFNTAYCPCADISRGQRVLTLCLSSMCLNDTEYWTTVKGSSLSFYPTLFPPSYVGSDLPRNDSTCDGDCVTSSVLNSTTPNVNQSFIQDHQPFGQTFSSPKTNVTSTNVTSTAAPSSEIPPLRSGSPGFDQRGGRAEESHTDLLPGPSDLPTTTVDPTSSTPDPGRRVRRRRRFWVTLALTVVVLVCAGGCVFLLLRLYRRRRHQVLEERSRHIALQPLVSTPLSLRAGDDDFVP